MLEEKVEIKAEEYGDFVRMMREKVSIGADGIVKISDGLWFGMADLIEGLGRELFEKRECAEKNESADTSSTAAAVPLPQGEGSEGDSEDTEPFFPDSSRAHIQRDRLPVLETIDTLISDRCGAYKHIAKNDEGEIDLDDEKNAVGGEIFGAALRETKTIGEDRYRCEVCVNAGTPLCESCNSIISNGNTSRPTRFMGFTEVDSRRQELTVHAYNIVHHVRKGQPLPMRWVMRYNELMCGKGER